jgi:sugar/nucleoside kinase (ribokinase family)
MRSARGANQALSAADVRRAPRNARFVHLTGYALLAPEGLGILSAAADVARRAGASLCFDPSSQGVVQRFGRETLLRALQDAEMALLLPNAEEARALIGAGSATEDARILSSMFPIVVVKDGPHGAVYAAHSVIERVPTEPSVQVDTTGAGDAFNAGLLAALVREAGLAEACRQGNRVARIAVSHYGGRPLPGTSSADH